MDFSIKLCLNEKIKRVPTQSSFMTICHTINDLFSLNNEIFSLYYLDEENDRIAIENETDYHKALEFSLIQNIIPKIMIKLQSHYIIKENDCLTNDSFSDEKEEDAMEYFQCNSCFRSFASTRSFMAHYNVCEKLFLKKANKFDLNKMRLKGIARSNGVKINALVNKSSDEETNNYLVKCKECSKLIKTCLYAKHLNKCKNKVKKNFSHSDNSIQDILLYENMFLSNNFVNYLEKNKKQIKNNKSKDN